MLPPGAMVPVHFGVGYNNWMPKSVGLLLWPVIGLVVFALIALPLHATSMNGVAPPTLILTVGLGVMLIVQIGAIRVAFGCARGG